VGNDDASLARGSYDVLDVAIEEMLKRPAEERHKLAFALGSAFAGMVSDEVIREWTINLLTAALQRRIAETPGGPDAAKALQDQLAKGIRFVFDARRLWVQGGSVAPSQPAHREADPIELHTGELVHEEDDLVVRGAGIDFVFRRTYRSRAGFTGVLGTQWDHAYHVTLLVDDAVARIWNGDLRADLYRRHPRWGEPGFTYYVPPDGVVATLEPVGHPDAPTGWVRREPDGVRHVFEPTAFGPQVFRLARIEDRFGNALRFVYADERLVRCEVGHPARWVRFAYDNQDRLIAVADHTGRTWRYIHDDAGDLAAVITPPTPSQPRGAITRFEYDRHRLVRIYDAAGRLYVENQYDGHGRVTRQLVGGGEALYTYDLVVAPTHGELDSTERPVNTVRVLERHSRETTHVYNAFGQLLRKSECRLLRDGKAGHEHVVWRHRYTRDGALVATRTPEGIVTQAVTGRDAFLRTHGITDEDEVWRHRALTAEVRRGFGRVLTTIDRAAPRDPASGVGWDDRFGDPWHPTPDDVVVRRTYEPVFGQLVTESDPRYPAGPEHDRHLTRYEYSADPTRRLVRVVYPTPTLPDGTPGGPVVDWIDEVDARGRVLRQTDPVGAVTTFEYFGDDAGPRAGSLRRTVVDPGGLALTTEVEVDDLGRVVSALPPRGVAAGDPAFATRTTYDALDRVVAIERPGGAGQIRTRYEPTGQLAKTERDWLGPDGAPAPGGPVAVVLTWNDEHRLTAEATGGGDPKTHRVTRHRYGQAGERISTKLPRGNRIRFRYDERLLLIATTWGVDTADVATAKAAYDRDGRAVTATTPEGRTTRVTLDVFGQVVERTDPLGHVTRIDYDRGGRVVLERGFERTEEGYRLLGRRAFDHDELGRTIRVHDDVFDAPVPVPAGVRLADAFREAGPGRQVTRATFYDAAGRVVATVDELGQRATVEYDAAGRTVAATDPAGNRTALTLDEHGNVVRSDRIELVRDLDEQVTGTEVISATFTYDVLDRVVTQTDGMGNATAHAYDSLDRRVRTTDPLGSVVETEYDVHGQVVATTWHRDPEPPAVVRTEYDPNGNAAAMIDALGRRTETRYDALDRPVQHNYPDGSARRVWYDKDGHVVRRREPHGVMVRTEVDALGRPLRVDADLAEVDPGVAIEGTTWVERAYDGLGRAVTSRNAVASIETRYDSRGLPVADTTQLGSARYLVTRRFDDAGGLAELTYPTGRRVAQGRDPLGRLRRVDEVAPSPRPIATFAYAGARLRTVGRGNGTRTHAVHDAAGRILGVEHVDLLSAQLLPDAAGNPRARIESAVAARAEHFGYDRQHQLTTAAVEPGRPPLDLSSFRPPPAPASPLPNLQPVLDAARGAPPPSTSTWSYDLAGNRQVVTDTGAPPVVYQADDLDQYTDVGGAARAYDRAGNLLSDAAREYRYDVFGRLVRVIDLASGSDLARYDYDPDGRRIAAEQGGRRVVSLHDGPDRIVDLDGTMIVAEYVHGDAALAPLLVDAAGVSAWYHLDAHGSVRALSDLSGAPLGTNRFDPFGRLAEHGGVPLGPVALPSTLAQPFGFLGRPLDPATGLYDLRARTYDPQIGRFLQRDPLGPVDGPNLYTYAGNAPLRFLDPLGLARQEVAKPRPRRRTSGSRAPDPQIEAEQLEPLPEIAYEPESYWGSLIRECEARGGCGASAWDDFVGFAKGVGRGAAGWLYENTVERVTSGRILLGPLDLIYQGYEQFRGLVDTGRALGDDPGAVLENLARPETFGAVGAELIVGRRFSLPGARAVRPRRRRAGPPDIVYRAPRPEPYVGPPNPHAARTPGEHVWGRQGLDRLTDSPFESWTSDRRIAEGFAQARGTYILELDLRGVPRRRIAADLRTPEGRAAAAAQERKFSGRAREENEFFAQWLEKNQDMEVVIRWIRRSKRRR
jgi:RHS repeat-associated protein